MATRGLDLAALSLCDVLDLARLIEEEALDRYSELADQMDLHHNPGAADFFRFMRVAEAKHGQSLTKRREALFGQAPRKVSRAQLYDVEAPEYDEAREAMSVREALQAALRSERKAYAFFEEAQSVAVEPEVRALLQELRDDEVTHQRMIEAQLSTLGPEPVATVAVLEDDPVPL